MLEQELNLHLSPTRTRTLLRAFDQTPRWQLSDPADNSLEPVDPLFRESLLGHNTEMLELAEDYQERYPVLTSELHMPTVRTMIPLHDLGEIIVQDMVLSWDADPQIRAQHKIAEHAAAFRIISKIRNPEKEAEFKELYERYERRSDKEALFTKYLDVVQATKIASEQFYDFNKKNRPDLEKKYRQHISKTLQSNILIINSLGQLLSPEAQLELYDASTQAFDQYARIGYPEEVAVALSTLTIQRPIVLEPATIST